MYDYKTNETLRRCLVRNNANLVNLSNEPVSHVCKVALKMYQTAIWDEPGVLQFFVGGKAVKSWYRLLRDPETADEWEREQFRLAWAHLALGLLALGVAVLAVWLR